jgi:hypothetical protein
MAQSSYPFDGLNTTETDYSYLFRELQDTGVVGTGTELLVTADASGLNVKVAAGQAIVRGHMYRSSAIETLTIPGGGSQPRIDRIVLRLDPTANSITLAIVPGQGAASPTPPALTQSDTGIYELLLADVAVPANAVTIQSTGVTDQRRRTGQRVGYWAKSSLRPIGARKREMGFNEETGRWEWHTGNNVWADLFSWSTIPGKPTTSTLDGRVITVTTAAPVLANMVEGELYFQVL